MALKSLHEEITKDELAKFGFSEKAIKTAADANLKVDDNQGNRPEDTHLHAMLGVVPDGKGNLVPENEQQGIAAITALIEAARQDILVEIVRVGAHAAGQTKRAHALLVVAMIGKVLHTIQDREFHHYGVWPHNGMCSALVADPIGLVLHGIHDTGNLYATLTGGSDSYGRWGIEETFGWTPWKNRDVSFYLSSSQISGGGAPGEFTATGGVCFGACGATRPTRSAYSPPGTIDRMSGSDTGMSSRGIKTVGQAGSGPVNQVTNRAEKATRDFLEDLRLKANRAKSASWEGFVEAAN